MLALTVESAVAGAAVSVTVRYVGLTSPEGITVAPSASVTFAPMLGCAAVEPDSSLCNHIAESAVSVEPEPM